ncbi:DedA family protein [Microbacterium sp. Marseille-Q6965]|uniref:DedA family protein n=1 Tax=Microbacterium sp. Marseille-Q6965 TaxID=2965072 RepID=UPI0021B6EBEA|nr:VTT domain-containing protein [Microbacterium sp. Marseille-Q6965]
MTDDWLAAIGADPWALAALFGLVFADSFLVVIPGEIAVTVLGSIAAGSGVPPLWAVIAVAATAAFCGDACCYLLGRLLHPERWRFFADHPRFQRVHEWAKTRLRSHVAVAVFTVRFIPFARLVVNVTAGATGIRATRYLPVAAISATLWAAYQALVGATIATLLPGGTVTAVLVSIAVALLLGWVTDALIARLAPRAGGR